MKKNILALKLVLTILVFVCSKSVFSQIEKDKGEEKVADTSSIKDQKRLKFGCGFGLNFVGSTNISLSPNLMYSVSNKVILGVGIQGSYASIKNLQNTTTFGGNVLMMYTPARKLSTILELAQLRVVTKTEAEIENTTNKYWDTALFVGAGFNITNKISVGAKYNLLYDEDESVYTSPIVPFVNITF